MKPSASLFILCALTLLALRLPSETFSAERNMPPGKYLLTDVVFEVTDNGGLAGGSSTVRVSGTGRGVLVVRNPALPEQISEFAVDPKDVLRLLSVCYQNRFFDLEPSYGPPDSPRLTANGEVEVFSTIVADAGGRTITLQIGSYSKTVSYLVGFYPPPILIEVSEAIEAMRSKPVGK